MVGADVRSGLLEWGFNAKKGQGTSEVHLVPAASYMVGVMDDTPRRVQTICDPPGIVASFKDAGCADTSFHGRGLFPHGRVGRLCSWSEGGTH